MILSYFNIKYIGFTVALAMLAILFCNMVIGMSIKKDIKKRNDNNEV